MRLLVLTVEAAVVALLVPDIRLPSNRNRAFGNAKIPLPGTSVSETFLQVQRGPPQSLFQVGEERRAGVFPALVISQPISWPI